MQKYTKMHKFRNQPPHLIVWPVGALDVVQIQYDPVVAALWHVQQTAQREIGGGTSVGRRRFVQILGQQTENDGVVLEIN